MGFLDDARDSLKAAEVQLRELATKAMQVGAYEDVQTIADWARTLADIYLPSSQSPTPTNVAASQDPDAPKKVSVKRVKRGRTYPYFALSNDMLVKTSWSKKTKAEYEHKAPWAVLENLLGCLKKASSGHRPITTEKLFPLKDKDGDEIPSYQAYLALAFLKQENVVEAQGRKGYTVHFNGASPDKIAADLRANLPET